jgi:hypothetical protein
MTIITMGAMAVAPFGVSEEKNLDFTFKRLEN